MNDWLSESYIIIIQLYSNYIIKNPYEYEGISFSRRTIFLNKDVDWQVCIEIQDSNGVLYLFCFDRATGKWNKKHSAQTIAILLP